MSMHITPAHRHACSVLPPSYRSALPTELPVLVVDLRGPPGPPAPPAPLALPALLDLVASTVEEDHLQAEEEIRPQAVAVDL